MCHNAVLGADHLCFYVPTFDAAHAAHAAHAAAFADSRTRCHYYVFVLSLLYIYAVL